MKFIKANLENIRWLYVIAKSYRVKILAILFFQMANVLFSLFFVETTKIFMDKLEKGETFSTWFFVFLAIIIKVIYIFSSDFHLYLQEKTNALMNNEISLKFFNKYLYMNVDYAGKSHSGDALNRLTTDVNQVADCLTTTLTGITYALFQFIATCIYLIFVNPTLTLTIVFVMPLALLIEQIYVKKILPVTREMRLYDSKVNQFIQEHLAHHELIVAFNQIPFITQRLHHLQKILYEKISHRVRLNGIANFFSDIAFEINYIVILAWGIYGIQKGIFSYAELIVFLQLTEQIQIPFLNFKLNYPLFISSIASIERLKEIENIESEETKDLITFKSSVGIKFSNVYFRYNNDDNFIYKNFSYTFLPGSITAVLGETGAGKSTLLRLILGTLKPSSGNVLFYTNEHGIEQKYDANVKTRYNCIYVPQGNSLISGTIRYNLLLGKTDATDEEMREALYMSAADFVVKDFPDGLDTLVGEGGLGLSMGQAQRIAIARSFLRHGNIILMDEPTSALDSETEKIFMTRLMNGISNKTIIIVTHKDEVCKYASNTVQIKFSR